MASEKEILEQASNSIQQQRKALEQAGEIPQKTSEPKRLSYQDRLAKLGEIPVPTPEEIAEKKRRAEAEIAKVQEQERGSRESSLLATVGRRYASATLDNYQTTGPDQQVILDAIRGYAGNLRENINQGVGLFLLGPPGTGKDHLVVAVMRLAAREGFSVKWTDGAELFASARDNIDSGDTEDGWARRFTVPDVLAISDPVPPVGEVKEGFQISSLFRIIDRRYRDMKPTFVTINVANQAEANKRMSPNIVDRLAHGSIVLRCFWESFRKPKQ